MSMVMGFPLLKERNGIAYVGPSDFAITSRYVGLPP